MSVAFSRFRAFAHPRRPKRAPRRPKRAPRSPQDGPRGRQEGLKIAQEGPKTAQEAPRTAQEGPNRRSPNKLFEPSVPRGPTGRPKSPTRLLEAPRKPEDAPDRPRRGPNTIPKRTREPSPVPDWYHLKPTYSRSTPEASRRDPRDSSEAFRATRRHPRALKLVETVLLLFLY